ncbi:MAG TPA: hypothetical protein VMN57_00895 [Anaerolineales bacterium]|nr:hypothetical protein [Anaerolineales bacterium]
MGASYSRRHLAAFFFFCLALSVYLLSYRGILQSDDEQLFAAVAQNLAFHGRFSAEQLSGNVRLAGEYNGAGISHVAFGALITGLLDSTAAGFVQGILLLPPVYVALTGALLLLLVCESGYPIKVAFWAACIFAFASIAWVYSQGFFRETLAAMFLTGSLLFGNRSISRDRGEWKIAPAAFFLLSLAGMVLTKAILVLIVPGILLAVTYGKPVAKISGREKVKISVIAAAVIAIAFLIARAVIPASVPTRYDFPQVILTTLQTIAARPQGQFLSNLLAPIFSPGRGLLFFMPVLIPGLFLWIKNMPGKSRSDWSGYSIAAVWSVAVIVVLEAATVGNEGWSLAWGPRRLLPVLPLIVICGAPWIEDLLKSRKTRARFASGLVLAAGIGIQLGGVLISRGLVRTGLRGEIGDFFSDRLVWDLRFSPIGYTWKLLLNGVAPDIALVRLSLVDVNWTAILFTLTICIGILLAGLGWVRSFSREAAGRLNGLGAMAGAFLLINPLLLLLAVRSDPVYAFDDRYREAASFLDETVSGNEAVIVDDYLSPVWQFLLNHNGSRHIAWHSLPMPGEEFNPHSAPIFRTAIAGLAANDSIWIVSENPEFQVGENFEHVASLLERYTLVEVKGFSDGPSAPSIIIFHFQRLVDD